ncbi:serine hydrolase domain-containing protein [Spirosoma litoris]
MTHSPKSIFLTFLSLLLSYVCVHAQSTAKIAQLDQYLQRRLAASNIPGFAIAIVQGDSLLLAKGYGTTETGRPVTADTPFAIASLSKAFTAMAIMQLVDSKQIDLDAPVTRYIPTFSVDDPRGASITIRQLLHQTSGLADTGFPELGFTEQPRTLDEAIARLKNALLVSAPGQQFHYHNPNYQILAKVVEAVSHQPFSAYLQQHIFGPLNMTHTRDVATTPAFYTGPDKLANGSIFALGKSINRPEPDWFVDGAAGMSSTINDMAHWMRLQLNQGRFGTNQLITSQSLAMMYAAPGGTSFPYGMGWFVNNPAKLRHNGILWTYSSELLILPKEGFGIVMLFNGGLNPFIDYTSFIQGVSDILTNQEPTSEALPDWFYPIATVFLLLIATGFAVRQFFRVTQWQRLYQSRPIWRSWLFMLLRLLPLVFLLLIPYLLTALSGRVLSWERIFLMMPDVILALVLLALANLAVVARRLKTGASIYS